MKYLFKKVCVFIFFALIFFSVSELKAQTAKSITEQIDAAENRSFDIKNRSNELERMKNEADRDLASREPTAKRFPEIKEDFERIQTVNANLLQSNALKDAPDYKTINKAAADIKKRAARLKKNLFPQNSNETVKGSNKNSEKSALVDLSKFALKPLTIALDNEIYRFVSNNIFQNINVVNLDDSLKAQNELAVIIKICTAIEDKTKN